MTLTQRKPRPYRYRLVDGDGEPVMAIRGCVPLEFSTFDFARGIGLSRTSMERPVYVLDGETGATFDLAGNGVMQ